MAINIIHKKDCVGCWACSDRCPKSCISMQEDEQGFRYPKVNPELCIECGLCEKVCPVINQAEPHVPLESYAAKNKDKRIQLSSSSGGVFTALAEKVISDGGVVFGARFNEDWEVIHDFTETIEGLAAFRKSKYVQSIIGDNFNKCEKFLKDGRNVLFSGTPCQIAGLKLFLRKQYDNLLTVDFICHGVPSPMVWREYLKSIMPRPMGAADGKNTDFQSLNVMSRTAVSDISFRDKRNGWEKYGFSVRYVATNGSDKNSDFQRVDVNNYEIYQPMHENLFMQGFLKDLFLRPSCYSCPAKQGKSQSDITLADLWGAKKISPEFNFYDGTSLLIENTEKGRIELMEVDIDKFFINFENAINYNPSWIVSVKKPKQTSKFWQEFQSKKIVAISIVLKSIRPSFIRRALIKSKYLLASIFIHFK